MTSPIIGTFYDRPSVNSSEVQTAVSFIALAVARRYDGGAGERRATTGWQGRTVRRLRESAMSDVTRRDFVRVGVFGGVAAATSEPAFAQAPAVRTGSVRPVVIASA